MTDDAQPRQRKRKRLWMALTALAAILAILIVPPFLSVSRYKSRITQLISASLGRPVRLSSVEVRLLPTPGFVLSDLTVEEDPAYGAEPVLHANTVTASIRLLSLWRGRLELDTISVDEASLNLVRAVPGRWNLDSLLRTATSQAESDAGSDRPNLSKSVRLPYLKATHSRINIKNGVEKLPFSLLDAEMSLEQQSPGNWRVRLRGQPARTDLSIEQGDTGIVRLEASLRQAPELRQMPLHVDLEWSEAQLGQLTRLLLGADAGWRGDLSGELHLDGTPEAAQVKTRLRATGVHRAEFAPVAPMDFDANCAFLAHFTVRAIDNLVCDSPLGSGRIRLTGNLPRETGQPHISVEMDRISLAAGLDALRTVRSDLASGLEVTGSVSGKITYAPGGVAPQTPASTGQVRSARVHVALQGPLTGSLTVQGLQLSGSGISQPIRVPKILLVPVNQPSGAGQVLAATVAIPAGAAAPLNVSTRLMLSGYQLNVRGQASISRGRELARVAGIRNVTALDALASDPVSVDLTANGPWLLPVKTLSVQALSLGDLSPATVTLPSEATADSLTGTVTLRNATWKADYLVNPVEISQATLHLASGELRWNPVVFTYGPVKGTANLILPSACNAPQPCPPRFRLQFGELDAGVIQAAFLGAQQPGTLLSTLIRRLRSRATPAWPILEGTVKAESLILGPVTFHHPEATLHTLANGAEITAFDAALLGGRIHGTGTYHAAATASDKPTYTLEAQFDKLSPPVLGQLIGLRFSGGTFNANGKIELTGFAAADLAASAKGALHFDWQHGTVTAASGYVPPVLARFDLWTADAEIMNGALKLKENQVKHGSRATPVQASVTLADPPKVVFPSPKPAPAAIKPVQPKR
ncbi:MAG: AsmA family protein [Terracidiphilus sp.]